MVFALDIRCTTSLTNFLETVVNRDIRDKELSIRVDWRDSPTQEQRERIHAAVAVMKHLQRLSISLGKRDEGDDHIPTIEAILAGLARNTSIETFSFIGTGVNDCCALLVATMLRQNRNLESLNLGYGLTNAGFEAIAQSIENHPTLKSLDLSFNKKITDISTLENVADRIALTELDLRGCKVGRSGAESLATVLRQNSSLTRLYLSGCNIDDDALTLISEALVENETLKSFIVGGNPISVVGHRAFESLLSHDNLTLELVNLPILAGAANERVYFYCSMNRADRKSFLMTDNLSNEDWLQGLLRMAKSDLERSGHHPSAVYTALRAKPELLYVRPNADDIDDE